MLLARGSPIILLRSLPEVWGCGHSTMRARAHPVAGGGVRPLRALDSRGPGQSGACHLQAERAAVASGLGPALHWVG